MQNQRFHPPASFSAQAHIKSLSDYSARYLESIQEPDRFWAREAKRLTWIRKWDHVREVDFHDVRIRWFDGGQLNVAYNCVERHVARGLGHRTAIIWEGNEPGQSKKISYQELQSQIEHFAAALKGLGVSKGDRVCIYMQMIPELPVAMLACARIGAVHSVVFGAFSADSLRDRINDSKCRLLITQDTGVRGNKHDIPMKANGDVALRETPSIEKVIVVKRTGATVAMQRDRDIYLHDLLAEAPPSCAAEPMDAEDPLFILYTSGSTGKPKGVLHTTAGYLLFAAITHELIFDYQPEDIYWCTADLGWVTGHSYIIYGPLCNAATTVMYEGVPNYPDYSRFWQIIEKYRVNLFYTAPTALRALMREGDGWPAECNLSSLRLLGSVGEPIKAPEWLWYHHLIGQGRCPIVDTWWQTETGGILIAPLPGATPTKPGSATLPFFGVEPVLLDQNGKELHGETSGLLCLKSSWPGQMRTVYGDHDRFKQTYFSQFPGYYFTGDGARRDEDGYYWITGRVDDVLNVSGHRIGTAEVEGAIGMTAGIAEAAVVGFPHDLKGQGIYAFVTPMAGVHGSQDLEKAIIASVRQHIGPHASPDKIQFTHGLPKTRSGKIMRRILRKIAENEPDAIGDISTLADPTVVESLIAERK